MITTPDGTTLTVSSTNTGIWELTSPANRPGVLRIKSRIEESMSASDQGIYTCTIPDSNNNTFLLNVGLYPTTFSGK